MTPFWSMFFNTMLELSGWLAYFFVIFYVLDRLMPCNRGQHIRPRSMLTDMGYYFVMPMFNRFIRAGYISVGIYVMFHGESDDSVAHYLTTGFGPAAKMPVWAQSAVVFLLSDFILYWTHRWFHGKDLWRFHAIHHSSTEVNWHSTWRFHPINVWLSFTLVDVMMLFLGFSFESVTMMGSFNMIYSAMVHANLNWTFGPFKYLFASPVFHRWHHTSQEEGMDKNFAPTFPLLDIMFGTFYMPEGKLPEHYGVPGANIPDSFLKQLVWPFGAGRAA